MSDTLTGNPQYDAITAAIKAFKFWNYGLDETDPNSEYAEWVPDLAGAIHKALTAPADPAPTTALRVSPEVADAATWLEEHGWVVAAGMLRTVYATPSATDAT